MIQDSRPDTIFFRFLFEGLLDFIYPPVCLTCEERIESRDVVCKDCYQRINDSLKILIQNRKLQFPQLKGRISLSRVITFWPYTDEIEKLISRLKYHRGKKEGVLLGGIIGEKGLEYFRTWSSDFLVPVPLHSVRQRERGYNQSEILCETLVEHFGIPMKKDIVIRLRNTKSQTRLTARERQENVRDAFRVKNPEMVKGKRVVLVDDVMTTGATLNSCAHALKKAGAVEIVGLAAARPGMDS